MDGVMDVLKTVDLEPDLFHELLYNTSLLESEIPIKPTIIVRINLLVVL